MWDLLTLPYLQRGVLEVLALSLAAGVLGPWIVLRGLAFFTHAVATATFPGLVLADGLSFAAPLGAAGTGALFALALSPALRRRAGGHDSATALALVGALAAGVILASDVFSSGAQLDSLLFGSLLTIEGRDVAIAAAVSLLAAGASLALGQRWLTVGFDPGAARGQGLASSLPDAALLGLVALAAVASLTAVGALLASSLLVVPAATTRPWARRVGRWQFLTVGLAAAEGVAGLWLADRTNAPPGASIAVLAGAGFAVSVAARRLRASRLAAPALALVLIAAGLALAGCGAGAAARGGIPVVATTTQLGDVLRAVGGPDFDVHQILQPNTDPHEYEPRPSDARAVAGARLVVESGDSLDAWMAKLVSATGEGGAVLTVAPALTPFRRPGESAGPEASRYDPHWWHDPRNVAAVTIALARRLAALDPPRRAEILARGRAYAAGVRRLDRRIAACFAAVPRAQRKLVTDHDAFGYFADRYGITVVGAVIPSQTTEAQSSARDVARLSALIRREHVRAVFPERSLSPKLAQAIARQTGARSELALYGDALGPAGSPGATYLGMEAANAEAMVRGFTGGRRGCGAV